VFVDNSGMTQNINNTDAAKVEQSYAEQMVVILQDALKINAGILSVSIDGMTTQYSRAQALKELRFWMRQVAVEKGKRPRLATVRLD